MERLSSNAVGFPAMTCTESRGGVSSPLRLVLDTNVVIDWLVFDHPYLNVLRDRMRDGSVVVITHRPALQELRRVLSYRVLKLDEATRADVIKRYERQTASVQLSDRGTLDLPSLPKGFPRCRDTDDNPFLALAYHAKASALVSRDKGVLKLKRRAARFGLAIVDVQELIEGLLAASS